MYQDQTERIRTNQQLCTQVEHGGDQITNLGGTCDQQTGDLLLNPADSWDYFTRILALIRHCSLGCQCLNSEREEEDQEAIDEQEDREPTDDESSVDDFDSVEFVNPFNLPGSLSQQGGTATYFTSFCRNHPASSLCRTIAAKGRARSRCGGESRCNRDFKCSAGDGRGCSCLADNFDIDTGFTGVRCGVSTHSRPRIGGRDVDSINGMGCPCNSSYVSATCCEATEGLVWEDSHLKLGELAANFEGLR